MCAIDSTFANARVGYILFLACPKYPALLNPLPNLIQKINDAR